MTGTPQILTIQLPTPKRAGQCLTVRITGGSSWTYRATKKKGTISWRLVAATVTDE